MLVLGAVLAPGGWSPRMCLPEMWGSSLPAPKMSLPSGQRNRESLASSPQVIVLNSVFTASLLPFHLQPLCEEGLT